MQGHMLAERTKKSRQLESAVVVPGSLVGCAAYLSSTKTRAVVTAAEPCKLVAFGPHELEKLLVSVGITPQLGVLAGWGGGGGGAWLAALTCASCHHDGGCCAASH